MKRKEMGSTDKEANLRKTEDLQTFPFGYQDSYVKSGEKRNQITATAIMKKHMSDFCTNISLPGFKYVGERGRYSLDRYAWFLVLTVSVFISSKYIQESYKKWQESPVLVSFNDSLTPISAIPFPAVTICPARQLSSYYDLENLQECFTNTTCSPEQLNTIAAASLLCPNSKSFQEGIDEKYYDELVGNSLKEIVSSCGEDMTWYKLNGDEYSYNCSSRFQTIFVDGLVCFTFNMLPARDLYNGFVLYPMIDTTHVTSKPGWNLDIMLKSADLAQTVPRYIDSNGRWAGLYINIEKANKIRRSACRQTKINTKIVFHHPAEIPLPDTHKFHDLPSSGDLFIHILPSLVTAREELLEYSPSHRKCYFSHEKKLSLFRSYTQRNCQLECRVNCSLSLCDCVPFYLPRLNNTVRICGRQHTIDCAELYLPAILGGRYTWREIVLHYRQWVGHRIQGTFKDYEHSRGGSIGGPKKLSDELLKSTYPDCICDCPAACTSLHYDVEIDQQPLPDFLGIETTRIALSFKEREFASVLRKELIGLTDFIANSGGVLGVFTGFSFLALVELIYYLTLRLWNNIKHSWDDEEEECVNDNTLTRTTTN